MYTTTPTKTQRVLNDLLAGWVLTELLAFQRYNIVSLAQVIHRLRGRGVPVTVRMVPFKTDAGRHSRFAEYLISAEDLPAAKLQFQPDK